MGEYYKWINVDKKEYLSPGDFDYGYKFRESMHRDSVLLHALHSMLVDEWKGDYIVWMGDECSVSEMSSNYLTKTLHRQLSEHEYSDVGSVMIEESYRNVSCFFKEAEKEVRKEMGFYLDECRGRSDTYTNNEYGVDLKSPYKGLFQKSARRYRFTINHSRKVYYSLNETDILFEDCSKKDYLDPLPILMGYGRVAEAGDWLGDVIGVSDERPEDYLLIREIRMDFDYRCIISAGTNWSTNV